MNTINISLPAKLKIQADSLIKSGFYASFSDLVRDSLRRVIEKNQFDIWTDEAKKDLKKGKAALLNSAKEIDEYMKKL